MPEWNGNATPADILRWWADAWGYQEDAAAARAGADALEQGERLRAQAERAERRGKVLAEAVDRLRSEYGRAAEQRDAAERRSIAVIEREETLRRDLKQAAQLQQRLADLQGEYELTKAQFTDFAEEAFERDRQRVQQLEEADRAVSFANAAASEAQAEVAALRAEVTQASDDRAAACLYAVQCWDLLERAQSYVPGPGGEGEDHDSRQLRYEIQQHLEAADLDAGKALLDELRAARGRAVTRAVTLREHLQRTKAALATALYHYDSVSTADTEAEEIEGCRIALRMAGEALGDQS